MTEHRTREDVVRSLMVERYGDPDQLALEALVPVPARVTTPEEQAIRARQRELWRMAKHDQAVARAQRLWSSSDARPVVA